MSAQPLSRVQLLAAPWIITHQAPLSMGFSRQEYKSGLPFPPPGNLPDPGHKPMSLESPALSGRFFTITLGSPNIYTYIFLKIQVLRKYIDSYTDTYSLNNSLCMFNTWHKKAVPISKHKFIEPGKLETGHFGCLLYIT